MSECDSSYHPCKVCKNQGATPIFHGIMGNFVQVLANSSIKIFYKTTDQKSFIFGLESPQGV